MIVVMAYKIYLFITLSKFARPGPANSIAVKPNKKKVAASPSPNISILFALTNATHIVIIMGMQANLVNNPSTTRIPQKNSEKITRKNKTVVPIPKNLLN